MSLSTSKIIIVKDLKGLSHKAASLFVEQTVAVLKTRPFFTMALSGGSTPESLYRLFISDPGIKDKIAWEKVHIFWGDERHVPPDHPQSNFKMAKRTMLAGLPVPPQNIHRVMTEDADVDRVTRRYEQEISRFFQLQAGSVISGPADALDEFRATTDRDTFIESVRQALYASKITSYAQGFSQLRAASDTFGWNLKLGDIAMLWRGGCIIRAAFLVRIKAAYERIDQDGSFHTDWIKLRREPEAEKSS